MSLGGGTTFTVKGGERLYAYFTAIDAPSVEMPADGAYRMVVFTQPWIMTDLTMMNGAHVVVLESEDLKRDAEGRVYLDASNEDTFRSVGRRPDSPVPCSHSCTVSLTVSLAGLRSASHPAL